MPVLLLGRVLLQQVNPLFRAFHHLLAPLRFFSQECPKLLLSGHSIVPFLALILVLSLESLLRRFRQPVLMISMRAPRATSRKREKGGAFRSSRHPYHRSRMSTIIRVALTAYIVSFVEVGSVLFFSPPLSLAITVAVSIYMRHHDHGYSYSRPRILATEGENPPSPYFPPFLPNWMLTRFPLPSVSFLRL